VTPPNDSNHQSFDEVSWQLNEGLRSCRAVVSGYRVLLSGDGDEEPGQAGFNRSGGADEEAVD
jgi:hypothetical protein